MFAAGKSRRIEAFSEIGGHPFAIGHKKEGMCLFMGCVGFVMSEALFSIYKSPRWRSVCVNSSFDGKTDSFASAAVILLISSIAP